VACAGRDRLYRVSDQAFPYARCRRCGVLYQVQRPIESAIANFYPADYAPYQVAPVVVRADGPHNLAGPHHTMTTSQRLRKALRQIAGSINSRLRRRFPDPLPSLLHDLYSPLRPGAILLDFGCGSESFLNQARDRGWQTWGVDFTPDVVEKVRKAGHRGLLVGPDLWEQIPDASVECVRLSHVLEHLYTPRETMAHLWRKMRPGGRLHIATPNSACLTFHVLGPRWFSLDCPRHIVVYTPRAARRLLRDVGFTEVRTIQEVVTKDMARSLGYWMVDRGRLAHAQVMGLQHHAGLAELLFTPARLASLLGMADRFHAVARKGA
jgi:2-polyprenyl-3-methyl-5-hydroxy-6-metoxy-1,4-benzoquinol methylase